MKAQVLQDPITRKNCYRIGRPHLFNGVDIPASTSAVSADMLNLMGFWSATIYIKYTTPAACTSLEVLIQIYDDTNALISEQSLGSFDPSANPNGYLMAFFGGLPWVAADQIKFRFNNLDAVNDLQGAEAYVMGIDSASYNDRL